jgi:hypothetical protein
LSIDCNLVSYGEYLASFDNYHTPRKVPDLIS